MSDQTVPAWLWALVVFTAAAAVGVVAYALWRLRGKSGLPRTRLYKTESDRVFRAALGVIDSLGCAVYHQDEQSISFASNYVGDGAGIMPVVHVVILPTQNGQTQVETIGNGASANLLWHSLAQSFLTALDKATFE